MKSWSRFFAPLLFFGMIAVVSFFNFTNNTVEADNTAPCPHPPVAISFDPCSLYQGWFPGWDWDGPNPYSLLIQPGVNVQNTPGLITVNVDWGYGGWTNSTNLSNPSGNLHGQVTFVVPEEYPQCGSYNVHVSVIVSGIRDDDYRTFTTPCPDPDLATVCVGSVVPTTWTVSGPTLFSGSGGSRCEDVPAGTYTVNAAPVSGYSGPTYSPSQTRTVSAGGIIGIDVNYSYSGGGSSGGSGGGGTGGDGGGSSGGGSSGGTTTPPPGGTCVENSTVSFPTPLPDTLTPGEVVSFRVRVNNTGDSWWYHGSFFRFVQQSNFNIVTITSPTGLNYGHFTPSMPPGDSRSWTFNLTAPTTPGTYTLNMRMRHAAGAVYQDSSGVQCAPAPSSDVYFGQTASKTFTVTNRVATLNVNSSGTSNVSISRVSGTSGTDGTTNYVKKSASDISTVLRAPSTANGISFAEWVGCNSVGGTGNRDCTVTVNVDEEKTVVANYGTPFNYSLSNSGTSNVTKQPGVAYTTNTITKTLTAGSGQSVILSVSGVPAGVSVYQIVNSDCSPNCTSTITFAVSPSAVSGTYPITVTGSPLSKQTTFNLVVSGSSVGILTCTVSAPTVLLNEPVTWSANVTGGTPPYTYSWSGSGIPTNPAPSSNPFTVSYSTIGLKSANVIITDADDNQATCPLPLPTTRVNFDPHFEEF